MAKDKTTAVAQPATKDSVDSVMDEIRSKNIMPTDLAKEVADDIAKADKDKKKNEMKRAIQHASYKKYLTLLNLRKRRKESVLTKETLVKTDELLSKLTGVTNDGNTVEAKDRITYTQYKELYYKLKNETSKAMDEIEINYQKEVNELDHTDCAQYGSDWQL